MKKIFSWYLRRLPHTKTGGFSFFELHHMYIGMLILLLNFFQLFSLSIEWNSWSMWLGIWLILDDFAQHYIQRRQMKFFNFYDVVTLWNWLPGMLFQAKKYDKY